MIPPKSMPAPPLIFVDTNILLDFYRHPQGDASKKMLGHFDATLDSFITTEQVEMEFKNNRRRVLISEALTGCQPPKFDGKLLVPAFLDQAHAASRMRRLKGDVIKQSGKIAKRIRNVVKDPAKTDLVYKTFQRLFRSPSPWNLTSDRKELRRIESLARRRFMAGYPPRKPDDLSNGDAINWEWIIHCAKESKRDIVIVSRDHDYGEPVEKTPIINDWLAQEFRNRVSQKRKILLTNMLTTAFKRLGLDVSQKEKDAEVELLDELKAVAPVAQTRANDAAMIYRLLRTRGAVGADFGPDYLAWNSGYSERPKSTSEQSASEPEEEEE